MNEPEINCEITTFENQCSACLSVGRKLSPLGEYSDMFKKLVDNFDFLNPVPLDSVQMCWECTAVLRRVCLFQQQLYKAYESLRLGEVLYCPLSSLTTIILNDTHPHMLYIQESNIQTDVNDIQHEELSDHDHYLQDDDSIKECVKSEERFPTSPEGEPKKPKSNKWARKRALLNKKPKFKILTDYTENRFIWVQINNEDLSSYMESQRDSEYFKSKRHKCSKCVLSFDDKKSLLNHNKKFHTKVAPYTCDICDSRISTKDRLARHVSRHYIKYECTMCAFVSHDRSERRWHYKRKHRRIFQCVKCRLIFGSRREFFKHYKERHEKFICDHCGISFKMRYCIKDHIRKQHLPLACGLCDKRFTRRGALWLHTRTVHTRAPAPAYCVECDTRYADQHRYRWHLANSARHSRRPKRRVPCPACDKVFTKNIYMKDHYNLVHLKHYKYRCERCNKNFIRNADLARHTRRVHEGILPPRDKICYVCGRGFTTNKILRNHVRTHTGERPHACATCGARFAQSAALTAHARALHRPRDECH